MAISIEAFHKLTPEAVKTFWDARRQAAEAQKARGIQDQGNRSAVTTGKNMLGFVKMVHQLAVDNGLDAFDILTDGRGDLTIPGFYRATKNWDLLIVCKKQLVAAIEFKSLIGPSFGNNLNNRVEEALGNSVDILKAYSEGVFGQSAKPFLGYFFVLEDVAKSRAPIKTLSRHFPVLPEFQKQSTGGRCEIFCTKLVREQLYDAAALLLTDRETGLKGEFRSLSQITSGERFATLLASKIAAFAAENPKEAARCSSGQLHL